MVTAIDNALKKLKASNERVEAAARKRYAKLERIAEMANTPAKKRAAERNMKTVLATLKDHHEKYKKTLAKLTKA